MILLPKNITLAEIPQRNGKVVINPTDKPTGNGRSNQALTLDEDWLICEVRRLAWLPLDDLHQILLPMFPKLSRSALHCLLKYYGISKKPKELQAKPTGSKFKSYEIGYLHIDITDFWLDEKRWSLFVSIDRETKFAYAQIFANKTMKNATLFLENVYKFYPYRINTILTDNSLQFSYRVLRKELKPNKIHPFDEICNKNSTEHRLTKFVHPWTNGQVEKMNHIIKEATLRLFYYESIKEYEEHLVKFLDYYNCEKKLKSLKFKSPYDKVLEKYQEKPDLFLGEFLYCWGG